jgi:hypothetical protein
MKRKTETEIKNKTLEGSSIWEIEGVELYIQESDFSKEEEKNSCFCFSD